MAEAGIEPRTLPPRLACPTRLIDAARIAIAPRFRSDANDFF